MSRDCSRTHVAYVDESLQHPEDGEATYILAAAVVEVAAQEDIRRLASSMRVAGPRFHWRDEPLDSTKRRAVRIIVECPTLHMVVTGAPVQNAKIERARRLCLEHLLFQLETAGISRVIFEARQEALNRRDIAAVDGFRARGVISHDLRIEHARPVGQHSEPLLWIPDAVAGVIGAAIKGDRIYLDQIEHGIELHEIKLS